MRYARAGVSLRLPNRGPPWIVVDFDLTKTIVARWPGKLWRVRVIEAANASDQRHAGGAPNAQATYVRAICVHVMSAESPALLFGPRGADLLPIFDEAARLSRDTARNLASSRHADAAAAYDRVLRNWAQAANVAVTSDGLDGVLKMCGGSPVNGALAVLHHLAFERARLIDGSAALIQEGDSVFLAEPWATAAQVIGDAALALGAPDLVSDSGRDALVSGWVSVFGPIQRTASP